MDVGLITEQEVRRVLAAMHSTRGVGPGPLLALNLVAQRLQGEPVTISHEVRAWALVAILGDVARAQLVRLRGTGGDHRPETQDGIPATLQADFRAGSIDLEAWSCLFHHYLSPYPVQVQEIAAIVQPGAPHARKLITRRLERGYTLLTNTLRDLESQANRRAGIESPRATPTRPHAVRRPADLPTYLEHQIAEWRQPQYQLDQRFVSLALLVDQGETANERWQTREQRFDDLADVLAAVPDPALVLLGSPGSGKSTLLRHLALTSAQALLHAGNVAAPVPLYLPLSRDAGPDLSREPDAWLDRQWADVGAAASPLRDLLADGRMLLLLDGLNELPAAHGTDFQRQVAAWREWLQRLVVEYPGNRVIFACRTLDYSAPLSSTALRVPHVYIEPLSDDKVRTFLQVHVPEHWETAWGTVRDSAELDVLRTPYLMSLLAAETAASGQVPTDRAALFTSFVRRAIAREIDQGNRLFVGGEILTERDLRQFALWQWRHAFDLPDRGPLVPGLSTLATGMQRTRSGGEQAQVRVRYDDAAALVDHAQADAVLRGGTAITVLDEDVAPDEVFFRHQLLQEYFAGRRLAGMPEPALTATPWRVADIQPGLREILDTLPPGETLPPLPSTGWEESMLLAASMAEQPEPFMRALMPYNLALVGRCARQGGVRSRLSGAFLDEVRWALVHRSRDPEADLRARIDAGLALGWLGDPRFERRMGRYGEYLVPPLVAIPGGQYPIGDDEPIEHLGNVVRGHMPRHEVAIASFRTGQFPVTNAEYACFVAGGGYEDEQWWDTDDSRAWRTGEGTAAGLHAGVKYWWRRFKAHPEQLQAQNRDGIFTDGVYERWRWRLAMTEAELDVHLKELYPGGRLTEPRFWRDERFNNPAQPVVGVCWYEARAYCAWLSADMDVTIRLPTEVEWEAAVRGHDAPQYAYGDEFDGLAGNTVETRLKRTSPVGVFVDGDTPEGVCDLTGNVFEWTSSLFGTDDEEPEFGYPYRSHDGREDVHARADIRRVIRGGTWDYSLAPARAAFRGDGRPGTWDGSRGFRVASSSM